MRSAAVAASCDIYPLFQWQARLTWFFCNGLNCALSRFRGRALHQRHPTFRLCHRKSCGTRTFLDFKYDSADISKLPSGFGLVTYRHDHLNLMDLTVSREQITEYQRVSEHYAHFGFSMWYEFCPWRYNRFRRKPISSEVEQSAIYFLVLPWGFIMP